MMWEKCVILDDHSRIKTAMKIQGNTEDIKYREEESRSIAIISEPTDKYHGNDDFNGDNNDDDEGQTKFK